MFPKDDDHPVLALQRLAHDAIRAAQPTPTALITVCHVLMQTAASDAVPVAERLEMIKELCLRVLDRFDVAPGSKGK